MSLPPCPSCISTRSPCRRIGVAAYYLATGPAPALIRKPPPARATRELPGRCRYNRGIRITGDEEMADDSKGCMFCHEARRIFLYDVSLCRSGPRSEQAVILDRPPRPPGTPMYGEFRSVFRVRSCGSCVGGIGSKSLVRDFAVLTLVSVALGVLCFLLSPKNLGSGSTTRYYYAHDPGRTIWRSEDTPLSRRAGLASVTCLIVFFGGAIVLSKREGRRVRSSAVKHPVIRDLVAMGWHVV